MVVTWDDWGGWFDHEPPLILPVNPQGINQGDYQYGFRVPLLVVSAYTQAGYVNNSAHDFGSILKMIEGIFNLGSLGFADARATTDLRLFFPLTTARPFTPIPAVKDASFFQTHAGAPVAPDND
jgi:phospholipase C